MFYQNKSIKKELKNTTELNNEPLGSNFEHAWSASQTENAARTLIITARQYHLRCLRPAKPSLKQNEHRKCGWPLARSARISSGHILILHMMMN